MISRNFSETLAKYKALQEEMEKYKTDLDDARQTIDDLQRQLQETQVSIQNLYNFHFSLNFFLLFRKQDKNLKVNKMS